MDVDGVINDAMNEHSDSMKARGNEPSVIFCSLYTLADPVLGTLLIPSRPVFCRNITRSNL